MNWRIACDYAGEYFYTNETLKFVNHEEGRVVMTDEPVYEYNLKDHLGNVRLTFTTQTTTDERKAGFETANQSTEAEKFENYPSGGGLINTQSTNAHTGTNSLHLNGGYAGQVGVAKSYSVMPGDVLQIEAYVKYNTPSGTGSDLAAFATSLLSAFNLSAPVPGETGTASSAINAWGAQAAGGYANGTANTDPKLFVTILIFDGEHNFKDVAYQQVSSSGALISASYTVKEPGYAYLYVSNEHPTFADSYFDDVKMIHSPSVVVALNDYYSFGLTMSTYQRENSLKNNYKFNGKEEQTELDLGWLDYGLRMYQPELGRWNGIDPLAEKYLEISPFAYVANNPTLFIDPNGAEIWLSFTYRNENDEEVTSRYQYKDGKLYNENGDEYDGSDVADPFFQLVKDQLNATKEEFGENEEISEMFSFLESEESGEHTINIQLSKENKTKGSGKKTTIDYNPLNWEEPDDFDKEAKGKRDPRIGLVHEMKHSSDHAKGRDPRAKVDWTYEDSDKVYLYSQFEARALNIENILRKALYGKTRATYNVLDENGKVIKIKPPKRYVRE